LLKNRLALLVQSKHDVRAPRHFLEDMARETLVVRDESCDLRFVHDARSRSLFALTELAFLFEQPGVTDVEARRLQQDEHVEQREEGLVVGAQSIVHEAPPSSIRILLAL